MCQTYDPTQDISKQENDLLPDVHRVDPNPHWYCATQDPRPCPSGDHMNPAPEPTDWQEPDSPQVEALANAYSDDRPTYAWWSEGEVSIGTLAEYADSRAKTYYGGFCIGDTVTELQPVSDFRIRSKDRDVEIVWLGTSSDYSYMRVVIRNRATGTILDAADYRVDLRA